MVLHGGCAEALEPLVDAGSLVVDPPELLLPDLIDRIEATAPADPVRLLLSPGVATSVGEEFLVESRIAEAMADDRLRVRRATSRCADRLLLAADQAGVLVSVEQRVTVMPMDADPMVEEFHEVYEPVWESAERFSTRAPPRQALYEEGREQLSEAFSSQLRRAIEHASTLEWHGSPTPVGLALAVAARTDAHHYDLCTWAEESGFTSRSTVARRKQRLEETGVLEVEPVPQERGRPRQRLLVGDARVADADAEELVATLRPLTA